MESLKELYKIGNGPSSSHTMGPKKAAERFAERSRDVDSYRVTLYGSLAAPGKGHLTDVAILSVLEPIAKSAGASVAGAVELAGAASAGAGAASAGAAGASVIGAASTAGAGASIDGVTVVSVEGAGAVTAGVLFTSTVVVDGVELAEKTR